MLHLSDITASVTSYFCFYVGGLPRGLSCSSRLHVKICESALDAVRDIPDGAKILVGGELFSCLLLHAFNSEGVGEMEDILAC